MCPFPHVVAGLVALSAGVAWQRAIAAYGQLRKGWFSGNCKRFRFGTMGGQLVGGAKAGQCVA